jgi:hypothetical protein
MATVTPAQARQQKALQARREQIVREIEAITQEIAAAQQQVARIAPASTAEEQPPRRAAA